MEWIKSAAGAYADISLDGPAELCYTAWEKAEMERIHYDKNLICVPRQYTS